MKLLYITSVLQILNGARKMREANSEDPSYKDKYNAALPYLKSLHYQKIKIMNLTLMNC